MYMDNAFNFKIVELTVSQKLNGMVKWASMLLTSSFDAKMVK